MELGFEVLLGKAVLVEIELGGGDGIGDLVGCVGAEDGEFCEQDVGDLGVGFVVLELIAADYQIFQESEQLINIITLILPVHLSKHAKLLNPHNLGPLLIRKKVPNSLPLDRKAIKLHLIILRIAMDNLDIIPLADE